MSRELEALQVLERGVFEQNDAGDNIAVRVDIDDWREAITILRDRGKVEEMRKDERDAP